MIERYSLPEMSEIWDERTKLDLWLEIELEVVRAWAALGRIPKEAAANIERSAAFSVDRMRELEEETHHDIIAFLKAVGERVGPDAGYIHLGMTSSDLLDTATAVQVARSGTVLGRRIGALTDTVREMALRYKKTPIVGRTHGVHAEPTSFGLKLAFWWDELTRTGRALAEACKGASVGKLSGAVGTFATLDPAIEERVCAKLGITPAPISSQIVARDRHAGYMCSLALLGSVIARQALEIRLLARTEVGEILEGFGSRQKGSSAMPHKRNPIKCEQLCGLARLLRSNALAALDNVELWHERDISHSSVERVILPDSSIIAHYMVVKYTAILKALDVRPERMRENLESSGGLVYSGTVLTMLVEKGMAREEAYDRVQAAAMAAREHKVRFLDRLLEDREIVERLGRTSLEEAFSLDRHLEKADLIFRRLGIEEPQHASERVAST